MPIHLLVPLNSSIVRLVITTVSPTISFSRTLNMQQIGKSQFA